MITKQDHEIESGAPVDPGAGDVPPWESHAAGEPYEVAFVDPGSDEAVSSLEDAADRLARFAQKLADSFVPAEQNSWDGACAALFRAMQLTRDLEREQARLDLP